MADILDMLGLTPYDLQKKSQDAQDDAQQYVKDAGSSDPAYMFNGQPAQTAPKRVDVDPNIPNASNTDDIAGPDFSKFFGALPAIKSNDQKFADFKKDKVDPDSGGFTDPKTGIRMLPVGTEDQNQSQLLAGFGHQMDKDNAMYAEASPKPDQQNAALAKYKEMADKFSKLGLTPPAMPDSLKALLMPSAQAAEVPKDEKKDDDSDEKTPGGSGSSSGVSRTVRVSANSLKPNVDSDKVDSKPKTIKDILSQLYGKDMDDDALKEAQNSRDSQKLVANLSMAANHIGSALSRGASPVQTDVQKGLLEQANQPVQDIMTRRAGLKDQMETATRASDLLDKEQLRDPNSNVSASYRAMAMKWNPDYANDPNFSHMSAEGVKQLLPGIDMDMKRQYMMMQKELMATSKKEDNYNKYEREFGNKVEALYSPRGPAGRAAIIEQSADRLLNYAAQYANRDNLTKQEVELLVKDMGTIMSGGTATEGSSKRIMPSTLESSFKDLMQKVSNNPTGADLGKFVKRLENAASTMKHEAVQYQVGHVNNLLKNYKSSLRPSFYETQQMKYDPDNIANGIGTKHGQTTDGKMIVTNGKETYSIDPKDLQHALGEGFTQVK